MDSSIGGHVVTWSGDQMWIWLMMGLISPYSQPVSHYSKTPILSKKSHILVFRHDKLPNFFIRVTYFLQIRVGWILGAPNFTDIKYSRNVFLKIYLLDENWIFNPVCSVWEYFSLALISNCFPDLKWLFKFDLSSTNITSFMNLRVFDENQNWVSLQICSAKALLKMQCHLLTAEPWLQNSHF